MAVKEVGKATFNRTGSVVDSLVMSDSSSYVAVIHDHQDRVVIGGIYYNVHKLVEAYNHYKTVENDPT